MEANERKYKSILSHFVKCSMKGNAFQNGIMILAVVLVTLLMTIIFGAGLGTVQNIQTAELRVKGTTANGFVMNVSDKEITDRLKDLDYVSNPGIQEFIGEVRGIEDIGTTEAVVMTSYSETEWKSHILPTITEVQGNYPKEVNEVMLSEWILKKLGINEPKTGMTVTIPFTTLDGEQHSENFTLSGWYRDYIKGDQSSGNTIAADLYYSYQGLSKKPVGNIIISEIFAAQYVGKESRIACFDVDKNLNPDEALQRLSADLSVNDIMVAGLSKDYASMITIIVLPSLLVVLVIICGYLLVYNIMNISISRDMHMFGQLKTLGCTCKQIKTIVRKKTHVLCLIGIPIGLLLGLFLSKVTLPRLLKSIMETGYYGYALSYEISVSPLICIFAAAFAYLTVFISCSKPARLAGKVSPIEALQYTQQPENVRQYRSSSGGKVYRMAYRNVFRSRKKAVVTLLSLFMGMFIFMVIHIALYDVDYEMKYANEIPNNFILSNLSYQTENYDGLTNFFNESIIQEMKNWNGVEKIICEYAEPVLIIKGPDILTPYIKKQAEYTEKSGAENFQVIASGLPIEQLLEFSYKSTLSEEDVKFLMDSGKGIFLPEIEGADYQNLTGKKIVFCHEKLSNTEETYTIAGILKPADSSAFNDSYGNFGSIYGSTAVTIYMSESGIRRFAETPVILDLKLDTDSAKDQEIQDRLDVLFGDNTQVKINSQLKTRMGVADTIDVIKKACIIFSLFLLFMGMVNFVNVIFTSIYSRQKELAVLESIGMTQGQIKKMLILEGIYYSVITMVLLLTVGIAASFGIVQLVKNIIYFAAFGVPIGILAVTFLIMLALCAVIPLFVFRNITKESIVERLRKGAD